MGFFMVCFSRSGSSNNIVINIINSVHMINSIINNTYFVLHCLYGLGLPLSELLREMMAGNKLKHLDCCECFHVCRLKESSEDKTAASVKAFI